MSDFHPEDDKWFSEMRQSWLSEQREDMTEAYGEDAVESVQRMTWLFADLIHIDRDNVPLIKAGLHRVAELCNEMLPRLNGPEGMTRAYTAVDMGDSLGDIPTEIQGIFLKLVGDTILHSKGGPFETATLLGEAVDRLVLVVRSEGRGL